MKSAINVDDFRVRAQRRLPRLVFDYLEGGAEDETCMLRNRAAIEALHLRPTLLQDVSTIDTSVELFGQRLPLPVAVAPTGLNALIWPDGDLALAHAAAAAGIPFALSTASNARLERIPRERAGSTGFSCTRWATAPLPNE